jgi:hypothetical protein
VRTYGRVDGVWTEVSTDDNGSNDYVWVTTLIQNLLLFLGESPFYANAGIPSQQAVIQQVFPDFYVTRTQQQFADNFASLLISKRDLPTPTYDVNITTHQGTKVAASIPI